MFLLNHVRYPEQHFADPALRGGQAIYFS